MTLMGIIFFNLFYTTDFESSLCIHQNVLSDVSLWFLEAFNDKFKWFVDMSLRRSQACLFFYVDIIEICDRYLDTLKTYYSNKRNLDQYLFSHSTILVKIANLRDRALVCCTQIFLIKLIIIQIISVLRLSIEALAGKTMNML